jgi:hypothetical protein
MHKFISVIILLALSSVSLNAVSASNKTELCHKGQEISVANSAVSAHLAHGDTTDLDDCDENSPGPDPKTEKEVVIMRCEAGSLVSFSGSFEVAVILPVPFPPEDANCAEILADLLNYGFVLRSITGGSAGDDGGLSLFTDYLLMGKVDS